MDDPMVDFYLNMQKKSLSPEPVEAIYFSFLKEFSEPVATFLKTQGDREDRTPSDITISLNLALCTLLHAFLFSMVREDTPKEIRKKIFDEHLAFFCDSWNKRVEQMEEIG